MNDCMFCEVESVITIHYPPGHIHGICCICIHKYKYETLYCIRCGICMSDVFKIVRLDINNFNPSLARPNTVVSDRIQKLGFRSDTELSTSDNDAMDSSMTDFVDKCLDNYVELTNIDLRAYESL